MRVAITGVAGFIGQALAVELAEAGHEVTGMDFRPAPYVGASFDLLDHAAVGRWLEHHRPDAVVHLAAHVGRVFGEDDRAHTVRANAEATALLAAATATVGARMVYASSSEVYGDHGGDWIDEDTPWRIPHNLYGLSKGWGEQACRMYAPDGLVIVRLSMPYGPGVAPGRGRRAMDTFLWSAHHRQAITAYRQTERSWCWVGDTVRGIRLAMEHAGPGTYNVGRDDDPVSMVDTARAACEIAGANPVIIRALKAPHTETLVKRLRMDRLRSLGWSPTVDLADGMRQVYAWVSGYDLDGVR